jgi:hypothetical protein
MFNSLFKIIAGAGLAAALAGSAMAQAEPVPLADNGQPQLILVSGGCGPNGWRGEWGHCHFYGGRGWAWRAYGPGPWGPWNGGCGPGRWRGPHGHCRVY